MVGKDNCIRRLLV